MCVDCGMEMKNFAGASAVDSGGQWTAVDSTVPSGILLSVFRTSVGMHGMFGMFSGDFIPWENFCFCFCSGIVLSH